MTNKEALKLALEALEIIANETYDSWTNGAEAGRIARTALLKIKNKCHAIQASDQMTCECGNVWDMNDPSPPKCAAIREALAQPEQEPVAWKPDRSGKYLTVVYQDVIPGDEVGAIVDHPNCVIMSWSNAVHDVEQLKNTTPPQRKPLTDEEILEMWGLHDVHLGIVDFVRTIEAAYNTKE